MKALALVSAAALTGCLYLPGELIPCEQLPEKDFPGMCEAGVVWVYGADSVTKMSDRHGTTQFVDGPNVSIAWFPGKWSVCKRWPTGTTVLGTLIHEGGHLDGRSPFAFLSDDFHADSHEMWVEEVFGQIAPDVCPCGFVDYSNYECEPEQEVDLMYWEGECPDVSQWCADKK